ncbi:hypothetical protein V1517DRAFT_325247 [Lipomyces orientalis]|uniref:Uncharacterized protein n=1 Tax=Lipomyces orientalis TaxID=1233043 RepID=A0ACC3TLK2_9ASCO
MSEFTPIIVSDYNSSGQQSTSSNSHRRRATEKRKQQNRVAQQKYREKQKRLLAQLKLRTAWDEASERPGNLLLENETTRINISPNVENSCNLIGATIDGYGIGTRRSIKAPHNLRQFSASSGAEHIVDVQLDASVTNLESITAGSVHALDQGQVACTLSNGASQIVQLPRSDALNFRDRLQLRPDVFDLESRQIFSGLFQVSPSDLHIEEEPTLSQRGRNNEFLESSNALSELVAELPSIELSRPHRNGTSPRLDVPHTHTDTFDLENTKANNSINTYPAEVAVADSVDNGNISSRIYSDGSICPRLPDFHVTSITLTVETTLSALLHNAQIFGLTLDEISNDDSISHFYRPNLTIADDVQSIQESLGKDIMPDLRPTFEQILYPHHSCLDLIPFPTMRARTIALLACTPPMVDELELEDDMMNGLICWRTSNRGSRQPWDTRSWEVQPWFLKKWSILLGGEEGEAWKQTMWWRAMRGESGSIRIKHN